MREPTERISLTRSRVRRLLDQQNRYLLAAFAASAPAPLIAAYFGHAVRWALIAWLLSPFAGQLVWYLVRRQQQRIRCPSCGMLWEHDEFLTWKACEDCGLPLAADTPQESSSSGSIGI